MTALGLWFGLGVPLGAVWVSIGVGLRGPSIRIRYRPRRRRK